MSSLNRVFIMGNITRDIELRYTPKGTAVADLGVAVNNSFKGQDGSVKEETVFLDVCVWARQAETCKEYLSKGSMVLIEGRLQLDQWEGKDGEKKSRLRVAAERVQFLSTKQGGKKSQDREPESRVEPKDPFEGEESPPF